MDHESGFTDGQGLRVKYVGTTDIMCEKCDKERMFIRYSRVDGDGGARLEGLECPLCGHSYPRLVGADGKTVVTDPHNIPPIV